MSNENIHNPWRTSIENILTGDNYLRTSEWRELLSDLDRLYAENAELLAALQGMLREFGGDTGGIGAKGRCAALCAANEVVEKVTGSAS